MAPRLKGLKQNKLFIRAATSMWFVLLYSPKRQHHVRILRYRNWKRDQNTDYGVRIKTTQNHSSLKFFAKGLCSFPLFRVNTSENDWPCIDHLSTPLDISFFVRLIVLHDKLLHWYQPHSKSPPHVHSHFLQIENPQLSNFLVCNIYLHDKYWLIHCSVISTASGTNRTNSTCSFHQRFERWHIIY